MLGIEPRIFRMPVECLSIGPHGQFLFVGWAKDLFVYSVSRFGACESSIKIQKGSGKTAQKVDKKKIGICMNIFLDDHAGDRTQNLSNSSRMPFYWATRSILGCWLG